MEFLQYTYFPGEPNVNEVCAEEHFIHSANWQCMHSISGTICLPYLSTCDSSGVKLYTEIWIMFRVLC